MASTLYQHLGIAASGDDPSRTQKTADDAETIDNDRFVTLYLDLASSVSADGVGRTESTRSDSETVDKDRLANLVPASLLAPCTDLYAKLAV